MPEQYIQLADGTTMAADWAGVSDGILAIQFSQSTEKSLAEIVVLLDDPAKTAAIQFHGVGEELKTFDGYTYLLAAIDRRKLNGGVLVQIMKGD